MGSNFQQCPIYMYEISNCSSCCVLGKTTRLYEIRISAKMKNIVLINRSYQTLYFMLFSKFDRQTSSETTIFDKIVGTKLGCLSNYRPRSPGRMLKHQISFLRHWGHQNWDRGGGGDHTLGKASSLQTAKGEIQCIKINKITTLQGAIFGFCSN